MHPVNDIRVSNTPGKINRIFWPFPGLLASAYRIASSSGLFAMKNRSPFPGLGYLGLRQKTLGGNICLVTSNLGGGGGKEPLNWLLNLLSGLCPFS